MLLRVLTFFVHFRVRFDREHAFRLLLLLLLVVGLSTIGIHILENNQVEVQKALEDLRVPPEASPFNDLWNCFWWTIVTITTVGYGDMSPSTYQGQILAIICMFIGIGIAAAFLGELASFAIERKVQRRRGLGEVKLKDHVVICGWNESDGKRLIEELLADSTVTGIAIISASIEEHPVEDNYLVDFIKGSATEKANLLRANIKDAKSVLILPKDMKNEDSDAVSALTAQMIRRIVPDLPVAVELLEPEHAEYLPEGTAWVDASVIGTSLLIQSLVDPGSEQLVYRLLSNTVGNTLYRIVSPKELLGQSFQKIVEHYITQRIIPIGWDKNGQVVANPPPDEVLVENVSLFVIAPERPEES